MTLGVFSPRLVSGRYSWVFGSESGITLGVSAGQLHEGAAVCQSGCRRRVCQLFPGFIAAAELSSLTQRSASSSLTHTSLFDMSSVHSEMNFLTHADISHKLQKYRQDLNGSSDSVTSHHA